MTPVLYGTDIKASNILVKCRKFILTFKVHRSAGMSE